MVFLRVVDVSGEKRQLERIKMRKNRVGPGVEGGCDDGSVGEFGAQLGKVVEDFPGGGAAAVVATDAEAEGCTCKYGAVLGGESSVAVWVP